MNNTIPCKPGIVDDDMNLAISELSRFLHQFGDIISIEDIADDSEGTAGLRRVDGISDGIRFCCLAVRYTSNVN